MKQRKPIAAIVLAALLALGAAWMLRAAWLPAALGWLDVGQRPAEADCVLVFAGAENTRPWAAAALYRGGLARRILITRVAPSDEVRAGLLPAREEVNRRVLVHCGVPEESIEAIGRECSNTFEEAQALRRFLENSPHRRVLAVTSAFHTRRARFALRRALKGIDVQLVVVSAPEADIRADNWWHSREGFQLVVAEYFKLAFYCVHYGWGGYAAAGLVVVTGAAAWWIRRRRRAA